ncbi:hypothetical protein AVEN_90040-1 [Araneus ventricosus]|uniref:Uncharacterized protein n=1 Tax=Araneus ventricosus TaxID=182803 RepID=A0A4Y2TUE5_ARAVE|nr:hypothetical protein AVEN_90040-1 [Araneus ventricosus]
MLQFTRGQNYLYKRVFLSSLLVRRGKAVKLKCFGFYISHEVGGRDGLVVKGIGPRAPGSGPAGFRLKPESTEDCRVLGLLHVKSRRAPQTFSLAGVVRKLERRCQPGVLVI